MEKIIIFFHHLFIPREENNYRAKALHPDLLTFYLVIALFLTFIFKQNNVLNILGFATDISIEKLYELTNKERQANNLSSLSYNKKLEEAAQKKAQDMFVNNYWSHYSPSGSTPWDFIIGSGYTYEFAGENLAKNFLFSQGVVEAWMKSPTHKENIVRKDYTEVGYAVANGILNGEQTTLVVQMFGKPSPSSLAKNADTPVDTKQVNTTSKPELPDSLPAVLSKQTANPVFTLINIPFNINLVFLSFLFLALLLDLYFASKLHIIRIGGKNIAHLIFIGFIVTGLIFLSRGTIL